MENKDSIGKYIIIKDLLFSDYFKDENGKIKTYNTIEEVTNDCWIHELPDVLILKVISNYIEEDE